jgi:hypothetical protein
MAWGESCRVVSTWARRCDEPHTGGGEGSCRSSRVVAQEAGGEHNSMHNATIVFLDVHVATFAFQCFIVLSML